MKLAVIFLNQIEYLEELLSVFLEIGVTGASVVDSVGMGHIISENIPIFAGLRGSFAGSSPNNKIIVAIVHSEIAGPMQEALIDICNAVEDENHSFMITLPVDGLFGITIPED